MNTLITGNDASSDKAIGGGIYGRGSAVTITDSIISDNTALRGGGISGASSSITVTNSTISGNSAGRFGGGGIFGANSYITVIDSVISGNNVLRDNSSFFAHGGGIFSFGNASVTVTNSTISGNTARNGGGIYGRGYGTVTVTNSSISGNKAWDGGGGIRIKGDTYGYGLTGNVSLTNSIISGNSAGILGGGGISSSDGTVTVTNSTISDNSSLGSGGILSVYSAVTVASSTISGNSATQGGGGGISSFKSNVAVTNSAISGNSANAIGGGIVSSYTNVAVTNSTISGNSASVGGGIFSYSYYRYYNNYGYSGYYGNRYLLTVTQSTVAGNSASSQGGGIYSDSSYLTVTNSVVAQNDSNVGRDLFEYRYSILAASYSLIGDNAGNSLAEAPVGTPDANRNLVGGPVNGLIDPLLGPLQDNGGPTWTHALLSGSPAIDAGDASAMAGVGDIPLSDQRGEPYGRVKDGDGDATARIDMGAYELQPGTEPSCDFDGMNGCDIADIDALIMEIVAGTNNPLYDLTGEGDVDLADRDAWLALAGAANLPSGNPYLLGDSNLDGFVDGEDFLAWNANKFRPTGTWSQGDWSADGITDGEDFLIWNANKFQSSDVQAAAVAFTTQLPTTGKIDLKRIDAVFAKLDDPESTQGRAEASVLHEALNHRVRLWSAHAVEQLRAHHRHVERGR